MELADGQTVPIVRGREGGYHLCASVRVEGLELDSLVVSFRVTDETTGECLGKAAFPFDLSPSGGTQGGLTAFLGGCETAPGAWLYDVSTVVGRSARLELEVSDGVGCAADDSLSVVLGPPE
jgi:hypothetical protein